MFLFVNKQKSGTPKMEENAAAIKDCAKAYLKRQNPTPCICVAVIATVLGAVFGCNKSIYVCSWLPKYSPQ